jgi:DNA-binding transcriptional regulator YhcF (GntR family)
MSRRESLLKKRRRCSIIGFEIIRLNRSAAEPLHDQLYRQIRDELRSGSFTGGACRVPSSRVLAVDLGISRLTVNLAFSKLHAEGYLRSKLRSGTFAAHPLPETFLTADKPKAIPHIEHRPRISGRVRAIPDQRVGNSLISERWTPAQVFPSVPGFQQSMNFPSTFGNGSGRRCSHKRGPIYYATRRVVATRICAKQLPLTCAISEAPAVIQTKS